MNPNTLFSQDTIDWSRVPEPQPDEYDTDVTLHLARCAGHKHRDVGYNPTILHGKVAVRHPENNYCIPRGWKPAPIRDPNIGYAVDFLDCWPEVQQQFGRIVHSVYPYLEPSIGIGAYSGPARYSSERVANSDRIFGAINVTVFDPIGTSEALVRELAHQKLWVLGVDFESANQLVLNSSAESYPNPNRKNRHPMTALIRENRCSITSLLHEVYAGIYVVNLQLKMIPYEFEKGVQPAVLQEFINHYFAINLSKLKKVFAVVVENIKYDTAGKDFFQSLFRWGRQVIKKGNQVITEGV